jgi:hypothetical protein
LSKKPSPRSPSGKLGPKFAPGVKPRLPNPKK